MKGRRIAGRKAGEGACGKERELHRIFVDGYLRNFEGRIAPARSSAIALRVGFVKISDAN